MSTPFVFLLDLDGTMQGDIRPQLQEYELIRRINRNILHGKKLRYRVKTLYQDMDKGLLRAGLKEALTAIKRTHPHVEFFVYTASTSDWAHFIISKIEMHCFGGVFFNRPLFTRSHCDIAEGSKNMALVFPMVESALSPKYPGRVKPENVFLIDNNLVLRRAEQRQLILCPSYDYTHVIDPVRHVPKNVLQDLIVMIVSEVTNQRAHNKQHAIRLLYQSINQNMRESAGMNNRYRQDRFFYIMAEVLCQSALRTRQQLLAAVNKLRNIRLKGTHYMYS